MIVPGEELGHLCWVVHARTRQVQCPCEESEIVWSTVEQRRGLFAAQRFIQFSTQSAPLADRSHARVGSDGLPTSALSRGSGHSVRAIIHSEQYRCARALALDFVSRILQKWCETSLTRG